MSPLVLTAAAKGPHIDWAGLSPLVALLGGAIVVLMVGLLRSRLLRELVVPLLALATFAAAAGLGVWQWGEGKDLVGGALRLDDLTIAMTWIVCLAGASAVVLSYRAVAPREAAHGEYYALLLTSAAGMVAARRRAEPRHAVPRARAAVDPALRPVRDGDAARALARVRAEVPHHRVRRLGDASSTAWPSSTARRARPTSRASPARWRGATSSTTRSC